MSDEISVEERAELHAMTQFSDEMLWTAMREQMQQAKQQLLSILMGKNSRGTISAEDFKNLAELVEDGQRLTLRKAEAMRLLMDRGYKISLDDMKPINE